MSDLTEVGVQEAVVIRPGDTLIVRIELNIDRATAKAIQAQIHELLPDLQAVLVLNADGLAVYRPDETRQVKPPYDVKSSGGQIGPGSTPTQGW